MGMSHVCYNIDNLLITTHNYYLKRKEGRWQDIAYKSPAESKQILREILGLEKCITENRFGPNRVYAKTYFGFKFLVSWGVFPFETKIWFRFKPKYRLKPKYLLAT